MSARFTATYLFRADAASADARARAIAVEQSVEMPLDAVEDARVLSDIVGRVEAVEDRGGGLFAARIGLAVETVGADAGQLLNMAFGNSSLLDDVRLIDLAWNGAWDRVFPGPAIGVTGLRAWLGVPARPFAGSALKPQGMGVEQLAVLAERFAAGGLDFIKDDHGLADQAYSPYAHRVPACAAAIRRTGGATRYIPSLTGDLDALRAQARIAREEGLDCVMLAPMIAGFSAFQAIRREFPDLALFAHPSLGGASRIAPDLLIGKLFTAIGADAVIFPSYGGRFGYSETTCRALATKARDIGPGALVVPAGGMTLARTAEVLTFYGADTMLLIGGNLLQAREHITREARRFADAVAAWHGG
jgi:ribulose-bisphosphate carboxylase large chain